MASKFANIEKVGTASTPKSKKDDAPRVPMAQVESLAALEFEIAALTTLRDSIKAEIKQTAYVHWIDGGCEIGRKPANFKATENGAEASCELRIKPSNRKLEEQVVTLMENSGLPVAKCVLVEKTIRVNPIYSEDDKLMNRVWDAVQKIKGLPDNFWQLQDESSYPYVAPNAIDKLFELVKTEELCRDDAEMLLPLITEPSFGKTKLGTSVKSHVRKIIETLIAEAEANEVVDADEVDA